MREEFEKLPEIAEILKNKTIKFVERANKYYCYQYSVEYLNGAWYAYQDQQKKIEQLLEIINTGLKIERNMNNQIHSLKEKIDLLKQFEQELLK